MKRSGGGTTSVPARLHLSILDAKTGQQVSHNELSCGSQRADLVHTASGQWLLYDDESVALYSSSFDKVRTLEHVRPQPSHASISPTGRTVLLPVSDAHGGWAPQLRDSATLEVIDSWDDTRFAKAAFTYSDRFIIAETQEPKQTFIREVGKTWNPFPTQLHDSHGTERGTFGFLNNETLVVIFTHELVVETVAGLELFRQPVPEPGLLYFPGSMSAISAGGERFAVTLARMRGLRNETLDMYPFPADDRVIVYSVPERGAILGAKVKGTSPWFPRLVWNRIALSPDGLLLGIASNEDLKVYALPASQRHED